MHDTGTAKKRTRTSSNEEALYAIATRQKGYFTTAQARDCGLDGKTLHRRKQQGRYLPGPWQRLWRLRDFPQSAHEEIMAAWLAVGDGAVISHESALLVHGISDLVDARDADGRPVVTITLPRRKRYTRKLDGVQVRTTLVPIDIAQVDGMAVKTIEHTLFDCLTAGTQPDLLADVCRNAIDDGLTTSRRLTDAAADRSARARRWLDRVLAQDDR